MEIWLALVVVSFALGCTRTRWFWSITVVPVLVMVSAAIGVANEPQNYDQHGLGYAIGVVISAACVGAWIIGRLLRWVLSASNERPPGAK